MNALVIEDDVVVSNSLKRNLSRMQFFNRVWTADNFEEGLKTFSNGNFDTVVIDIGLRDGDFDGLDLCRIIRARNKELPIMVISGQKSLVLLEKAFEIGVNEFVFKPFNIKEVELRIKRWLRI